MIKHLGFLLLCFMNLNLEAQEKSSLYETVRPLAYNDNLLIKERLANGAQRSFFAGHTAATAAATCFTAKVSRDFNPHSPAMPFVWAGGVAGSAYVEYFITKARNHFLTDNMIGFGIGAACGILVPEIHKTDNKIMEVYPTVNYNVVGTGIDTQGTGMTYSF